jgi:hypothetical protein
VVNNVCRYDACEITFQPKMSFKNGGKWFEVSKPRYVEVIAVASYFHANENEDAVSHSFIIHL